MHDLATINRLNFEAFGQAISRYRAQGRHVLTQHEGAHLVGFETFEDASAARDALALHGNPGGGTRYQLLEPFAPDSAEAAAVRGRDQSEDYLNAARA